MSLPSADKPAVAATPAAAGTAPARIPGGSWLLARVGADRVSVRLMAPGRPARELALEALAANASEGSEAAPSLADLLGAVGLAVDALSARGVKLRGLSCDVVFDDSWMQYDILRSDLRTLPAGVADDLVRAALADVAGLEPVELEACWQAQPDGESALACALAAGTIDQLRGLLRARHVALGSVEGEFVHEFNRNLEQLQAPVCVVAVVRRAGAQLAVLADGVVRALSYELGSAGPAELEMRARGLLNLATAGDGRAASFVALAREGWPANAPWATVPLPA